MKMGMVEGIVPDPEDTFRQTSSPFSLLSKTLKNSRKGMELDDHRSYNVQNLLNSMELKDQIKAMDQAKEILKSNLELSCFEFAVQIQSQNEGVASENVLDQPRRQRPGLSRKRARFSLIPTKSQPVPQADPRAILKDLDDPMEYFDALENIERAEKEIKRLRGETVTEPTQPTTRRVRPGLNIRRKTTFNQIYQKFVNEKGNLVPPLGGKENWKVPTPSQDSPDFLSEATEKSNATPEREAPVGEPPDFTPGKGSIGEMEETVNKSLDKLLMTCRDLDESQILNLLQERLNFKPRVSEKLNLPEFDIVPNIDLKSQEKLRRPSRDSSSLQSMVGPNTNWKTLIEDRMNVESSRLPPTPANPHTSPHSLISALRGSSSPLDSESDLISLPFNSDVSSPKQSLAIDGMDSEILSPPNAHEMETRISIRNGDPSLNISENRSSNKLLSSTKGAHDEALSPPIDVNKIDIVRNSGSTSDNSPPKHEKSASFNGEYQTSTMEGYNMNSGVNDRILQREDPSHPVSMLMDADSNRSDKEMNVNGLEGSLDGKVNDKPPEGSVSQEPGQCIVGLTMETARDTGNDLDEPSPTAGTCPPQSENLETWNLLPEQNNEDQDIQVPSTVLSGEGLKTKAPPHKRQKSALRHRFSLTGAGTTWQNGLRRSKRESRRPLQFWKGERLLYGRVHDSLATVIGAKYATASENEDRRERSFNVKCFVSNEYADLVKEVARH